MTNFDLGAIVQKATIHKLRLDRLSETLKQQVTEQVYKLQSPFRDFLTDKMFPAIYDSEEIQTLLKADEATQDQWIRNLRKGLGLDETETAEKKAEHPVTDVQKAFEKMTRQQPEESTEIGRKFEEMLKRKSEPKGYVS